MRNYFNERAHVQTSAQTVNRGRNAKSGYDEKSLIGIWDDLGASCAICCAVAVLNINFNLNVGVSYLYLYLP